MRVRCWVRRGVWFGFAALAACGGGGGNGQGGSGTVPGAPIAVEVNTGDTAVSLGWDAPASDGGSAIQNYVISISPAAGAATIDVVGTSAVVRGLANGTHYTFSVVAHNAVGDGPAATVQATPSAIETGDYVPLAISGDSSPSGIYDASVVKTGMEVWMAYSGVNFYLNGSSQRVQDVSTRIAHSTDGGQTFSYVATVGTPQDTTVTDTTGTVCGSTVNQTCSGRWVYETPWLVDDSTDPNPARRFKLFAHKYFLYPPAANSTIYVLGAIVMWTASAPDTGWSAESTVLRWTFTPPELLPAQQHINTIDAALAPCLAVAEGGVSLRNGALDFVLSCTYVGGSPLPQKTVLLRSTDHANSFQYVATLLQPADATALGADHFTAPSLAHTQSNVPVLIATPVYGGLYTGCVVFPVADEDSGALFRPGGLPISILDAPVVGSDFGGACAWDRDMNTTGILLNDVDPSVPWPPTFRILSTKHPL